MTPADEQKKRAQLTRMGLPPHAVNAVLRTYKEHEEHSAELRKYATSALFLEPTDAAAALAHALADVVCGISDRMQRTQLCNQLMMAISHQVALHMMEEDADRG